MKNIDLKDLVRVTGGQQATQTTQRQQFAGGPIDWACQHEADRMPDGYTSRFNRWCGN